MLLGENKQTPSPIMSAKCSTDVLHSYYRGDNLRKLSYERGLSVAAIDPGMNVGYALITPETFTVRQTPLELFCKTCQSEPWDVFFSADLIVVEGVFVGRMNAYMAKFLEASGAVIHEIYRRNVQANVVRPTAVKWRKDMGWPRGKKDGEKLALQYGETYWKGPGKFLKKHIHASEALAMAVWGLSKCRD